ncbi:ACT domain-containing protein [Actinomadura craniellae]|uniref:ACT domain-containing protein n=1 Tax=Actinomadura craniellae TaxID=2231787 RepID=A0A365H058_9ACTN|nr:ACT domain-containing protein [Actinomadura craniellae]RAY12426.1 ACT domain-containing protein [Actinomadura craniellae]
MSSSTPQRLRVVPSRFSVGYAPQAVFPEDDEWIALVRAPEGLTVVREAWGNDPGRRWVGLYGGDDPRDLGAPGALAAITGPLAGAGIPVFVASTYHADLVLVPEEDVTAAVAALERAGHPVDLSDLTPRP